MPPLYPSYRLPHASFAQTQQVLDGYVPIGDLVSKGKLIVVTAIATQRCRRELVRLYRDLEMAWSGIQLNDQLTQFHGTSLTAQQSNVCRYPTRRRMFAAIRLSILLFSFTRTPVGP